jgi:hypothetical protein
MIFPHGQLTEVLTGGATQLRDAEAAVGFSPYVELALTRHLSIGAGAELRFNVRPAEGFFEAPGHAVNLSLRAKLGLPLYDTLRVYVLATPTYSFLLRRGGSASGPALGLTAGVAVIRSPTYRPFVEAGYEWGFQRLGGDGALSARYLVLVAGVQLGF